jgi:hypothetical protein
MLRAESELTILHSCSFSSIQKYCSQTPARNAIYAHARDFVVHELLLPTVHLYYPHSEHSHNALAHYTLLEMLECCQCACVVAELSVAPNNSSPVFLLKASSPTAPHQIRPSRPASYHLDVCGQLLTIIIYGSRVSR